MPTNVACTLVWLVPTKTGALIGGDVCKALLLHKAIFNGCGFSLLSRAWPAPTALVSK